MNAQPHRSPGPFAKSGAIRHCSLSAAALGLLFGLVPALQATKPQLVPALKDVQTTVGSRYRRFGLRNALVVVQVAISMVLLVAAGLFVRSLIAAQEIDPGFGEEPEPETLAAVGEACSIDEVAQALGDALIDEKGAPLSAHHRLLLLAGRVVPAEYRVPVVPAPVCWLNAVQGELWRAAVVRASVGRTALWITTDRDLAARAFQVAGAGTQGNADLGILGRRQIAHQLRAVAAEVVRATLVVPVAVVQHGRNAGGEAGGARG